MKINDLRSFVKVLIKNWKVKYRPSTFAVYLEATNFSN